jgi:hypothetical protein
MIPKDSAPHRTQILRDQHVSFGIITPGRVIHKQPRRHRFLSVLLVTLNVMPNELPQHLRELAQFQQGILTMGQVRQGGLTKDFIRSRVRQERWQRMHAGVYAVFSGEPGRAAVLWGAVLRAGPGAILSYHTAAELAALVDSPSTPIHVTIPDSRRIARIPGLVVHVSGRVRQVRHPALAPAQTRIEETVLDLTQLATTAEAAYGWMTRALGRRVTTQARLLDAMALRNRLRWRRDLTEALAADWAGVHSGLEHRYLRDVERPHALPPGSRQALARRAGRNEYRDALYKEYGVAVELDGRAAHPGDLRWRDIRRDNSAAADGIVTLRYGWVDVSQRPCWVAAQVAQVLRRRGYSGFRPCAPGCPVALIS